MQLDDERIVNAFVTPVRRERWRASLAVPARRSEMLRKLDHCRDLDDRYARSLPSGTDVVTTLRRRGAPATCYVLSGWAEIDGRTMGLEEAIDAAAAGGFGTILGCLPGKLGFYYGECGERRIVLERPPHDRPF